MIGPAAIYLAFNASGPGARGWGIPMATDIAFALGILALLGPRVPVALRVFLTALAIADDLGSVLVIAFFYTEGIRWSALGAALVLLPVVALTMRFGIRRPLLMALPIAGVWMAVLASGVHATVAGILVALVVPMRPRLAPADFLATVTGALAALRTADLTRDSVLTSDAQLDALVRLDDVATDMRPPGLTLERVLHPIQALVILPLFALVNAGVDLTGRGLEALADPVTLGVIAGLLLGKPLGIGLSCWLAVQSGHARLPDGVTGLQIAGVGLLGGVGFTMSLFVSELAFGTGPLLGAAKLGILAASSAAGLSGYLVLGAALPRSSSSRAVPATG
jgi:NhaA family Na+:H+ antiporter